jgi:hypothetical protein
MACAARDRLTRAGAKVDDHALGAGRQIVELADVHFQQSPTDYLSHSPILPLVHLTHFWRSAVGSDPHN